MSTTYVALFHVFRKRARIVAYEMDLEGNHRVFAPQRTPLAQFWPNYGEAQGYLDTWFAMHLGEEIVTRKQHTSSPGDLDYPRALADLFSRDPHLGMWAYATRLIIPVSLHQIALAIGQTASKELRLALERKGLSFVTDNSGHHLASLNDVYRTLGADFTDRLLLYPRQAAAFLGVTSHAAPAILRRLGVGLERDSRTFVEWRDLQRIQRISRQGFELQPIQK